MNNKIFLKSLMICLLAIYISPSVVMGWSEHPLITRPVIQGVEQIMMAPEVEVKSLARFLAEEEAGIEKLLAEHEARAREVFRYYQPRPDHLAFKATGNQQDLLQRFFYAIRINPNVKMALYLHLLPTDNTGGREAISPYELTTLTRLHEMLSSTYVRLDEGEWVHPLYVLTTATDEPDYGFDLGLFEDNNSAWGAVYGFGNQSFGNPSLEYGTQAPFHMGFYHESGIVFAAAPFLRRTYVDYRIDLYKSLAVYAFRAGQPYWGYRFMGWAMHYLNDLSMPYHASVMPAKRSLGMLWINLKAMLGFPRSRDNAVVLLSNRHTVYEHFQWLELRRAYLEGNRNHPFMLALTAPSEVIPYHDAFPVKVAARESAKIARKSDRLLVRNVPRELVRDPSQTLESSELDNLTGRILAEKGQGAVDEITDMIASRFRSLSMHVKSFVAHVLEEGSGS